MTLNWRNLTAAACLAGFTALAATAASANGCPANAMGENTLMNAPTKPVGVTDTVLEQIDLTEKANHRVKTYSGGMKRRVNIGVGLLHKPRLLFMDEPTVGIDPQSRRAILDTVKDLNKQGMTVLYTTHYMEEAQELSDRVGIIDHGELIALGTQKELTQQVGETETLILHIGENDDPGDERKEEEDPEDDLGGRPGLLEERENSLSFAEIFDRDGLKPGEYHRDRT